MNLLMKLIPLFKVINDPGKNPSYNVFDNEISQLFIEFFFINIFYEYVIITKENVDKLVTKTVKKQEKVQKLVKQN